MAKCFSIVLLPSLGAVGMASAASSARCRGVGLVAADAGLRLVEQRPAQVLRVALALGQRAVPAPRALGRAERSRAEVDRRAHLPDLGLEVEVADLPQALQRRRVGLLGARPVAAVGVDDGPDVPHVGARLALRARVDHGDGAPGIAVGHGLQPDDAAGRRRVDEHPRQVRGRPALLAEVEAGERAVEQDGGRVALQVADLAEDLVTARGLRRSGPSRRAGARGSAPGGSDAPPARRPRAPATGRRRGASTGTPSRAAPGPARGTPGCA